MMEMSLAHQFAQLPKEERDKLVESMTPQELHALQYEWSYWARPKQLLPITRDDWNTFLFNCGRGFGKALSLTIPTLTANRGWIKWGELQEGDILFDEQGQHTKVTKIHDTYIPEIAYRFHFNDGTYIDACAEHYWATWTARDRKQYLRHNPDKEFPKNWVNYVPETMRSCRISYTDYLKVKSLVGEVGNYVHVSAMLGINYNTVRNISTCDYTDYIEQFGTYKSSKEIYETQFVGKRNDRNHCIFNTQPLQYDENPDIKGWEYYIGLYIGDGYSENGEICGLYTDLLYYQEKLEELGHKTKIKCSDGRFGTLWVEGARKFLKSLEILGNKDVPNCCIRSSLEQRLEILKGLNDTDGHVNSAGSACEFSQSNEKIAMAFYEILVSLGMSASVSTRFPKNTTTGKLGKKNWRIKFLPTMQVFSLPRKVQRCHIGGQQFNKRFHRMITKVEQIESVPMRCITVDSPNSMYLIGKQLIPTRNSTSGTQWVRYMAENNPGCYIAVVGPTTQSLNRTLVEGDTGLLTVCPPGSIKHETTKAQIKWKNGSVARFYSAEKPDRLRGPNHHFALADEVVAWKNPEVWDMLQLTLRLGKKPRTLVTTTPRPTELILKLIGGEENVPLINSQEITKINNTLIVRGTTFENVALSEQALQNYRDMYLDTATGEQELFAKLLINVQGALFKKKWIHHYHLYENWEVSTEPKAEPVYTHTIVAVDPAATSKSHSDQTAICVASRAEDGRYYVRHCEGHRLTPDKWAQEVIRVYKKYNADKIVCEVNNGGDMVENTIRVVTNYYMNGRTYTIDGYTLPIEKIHAKRGKLLRAEEIALLYEQGRVTHIHEFEELEAQMVVFKGEPNGADDLVDAMVYALKELSGTRMVEYNEPMVIGAGLISERLPRW